MKFTGKWVRTFSFSKKKKKKKKRKSFEMVAMVLYTRLQSCRPPKTGFLTFYPHLSGSIRVISVGTVSPILLTRVWRSGGMSPTDSLVRVLFECWWSWLRMHAIESWWSWLRMHGIPDQDTTACEIWNTGGQYCFLQHAMLPVRYAQKSLLTKCWHILLTELVAVLGIMCGSFIWNLSWWKLLKFLTYLHVPLIIIDSEFSDSWCSVPIPVYEWMNFPLVFQLVGCVSPLYPIICQSFHF